MPPTLPRSPSKYRSRCTFQHSLDLSAHDAKLNLYLRNHHHQFRLARQLIMSMEFPHR
ncbi:hypothetical protein X946_5567 [Burkholderia sp. ABCPW 111]|nr:hypothetical protein X946_5567 [Burkholderia sp. ABCPW 111]